jgi:hypothetical protein
MRPNEVFPGQVERPWEQVKGSATCCTKLKELVATDEGAVIIGQTCTLESGRRKLTIDRRQDQKKAHPRAEHTLRENHRFLRFDLILGFR